jgi:RNA polymerase I-specific transcription initiation factor RRN6
MPSGFPSLQPAFTVRVAIDAPMSVGGQAGSQLVIVPMVSGTVQSEPNFEPKFDGELCAFLDPVYEHVG